MNDLELAELLSLRMETTSSGMVKYFNSRGECHRKFGPAMIMPNGDREWLMHDQNHRDDGPAVEYANLLMWYQNGQLHREDGPAYIIPGHCEDWFLHGRRHRIGGPAVIDLTHMREDEWWENGHVVKR